MRHNQYRPPILLFNNNYYYYHLSPTLLVTHRAHRQRPENAMTRPRRNLSLNDNDEEGHHDATTPLPGTHTKCNQLKSP